MQRYIRLFLLLLLLGMVGLTACGGDDDDDSNGNQDNNTNGNTVNNNTSSSGLNVGDPAPAFNLPSADGGEVSLADYMGEQPVLLYFHMAVG